MVQAIQNDLPKARVVYCSATGVSEVGNMAFMMRLVRRKELQAAVQFCKRCI